MTFDEWFAMRNADYEAEERKRCALEEREIRYWAGFREAFRKWPDLVARLDEPVPIEDRIRQRRAERVAHRMEANEAWARLYRSATDSGVPLEPPSWS